MRNISVSKLGQGTRKTLQRLPPAPCAEHEGPEALGLLKDSDLLVTAVSSFLLSTSMSAIGLKNVEKRLFEGFL